MTYQVVGSRLDLLHILTCIGLLLVPMHSEATTYTSENFLFSYHEKPATFTQVSDGGFTGTTVSGKSFTQTPVTTHPTYRLHRFQIDQVFFYVSDQGTFQASGDLVALSIYSFLQNRSV